MPLIKETIPNYDLYLWPMQTKSFLQREEVWDKLSDSQRTNQWRRVIISSQSANKVNVDGVPRTYLECATGIRVIKRWIQWRSCNWNPTNITVRKISTSLNGRLCSQLVINRSEGVCNVPPSPPPHFRSVF